MIPPDTIAHHQTTEAVDANGLPFKYIAGTKLYPNGLPNGFAPSGVGFADRVVVSALNRVPDRFDFFKNPSQDFQAITIFFQQRIETNGGSVGIEAFGTRPYINPDARDNDLVATLAEYPAEFRAASNDVIGPLQRNFGRAHTFKAFGDSQTKPKRQQARARPKRCGVGIGQQNEAEHEVHARRRLPRSALTTTARRLMIGQNQQTVTRPRGNSRGGHVVRRFAFGDVEKILAEMRRLEFG